MSSQGRSERRAAPVKELCLEPFEPRFVLSAPETFDRGIWHPDATRDDTGNTPRGGDLGIAYREAGDTPVVGDWDSNEVEEFRVFRAGQWFLDLDGIAGLGEKLFAFGMPVDVDDAGGAIEEVLSFGMSGDRSVAGHWNLDGVDEIGVKKGSSWLLDLDGVGGGEERAYQLDTATSTPVSLARREFFVSPTGSASAPGTLGDPLSLEAAISQNSPARPGDTIWVLGGTYKGHFTSLVNGTATSPVTIRAMPGQRATVDGSLTIGMSKRPEGAWSRVRGLEVTSSLTERVSAEPGSFPTDITIGTGVDVFAPNVSVVNMVIHDIVGNGIGVWRSATNTLVYGNLVYNNGWKAPDRGHGHGIYSQNEEGVKVIRDNIIFQNLGQGLTAHGSGVQRGWRVEGNTMFRDNLNMGFYDTIHSIHLIGNRIYEGTIRTLLRSRSTDLVLRGNYTTENLQLQLGRDLICTDNRSRGVKLTVPTEERLGQFHLDRNTYVAGPLGLADSESSTGYAFAQWQALGFDPNGSYVASPTDVDLFVIPNAYEGGRGHVTVYNWALQNTVEADVSSILEPGDRYEVRDVQNYWGAPVASGTYDGEKVALPMNLTATASRNGNLWTPRHTSSEYNAFVVVRVHETN